MVVAAVDQLVGAPGEAALGRLLPGRQPVDQRGQVEVAVQRVEGRAQDAQAGQPAEGVGAVGFVGGGAAEAAFEGLAWAACQDLSGCVCGEVGGLQLDIHSGSLSMKVVRPWARAGASGGRSTGRLRRDMMTMAQ